MLYLFVAVLSIYAYSRVITKSERFTVITGKGYRPRLLQLGRWRWPAFGLVLLYLALSTIIPFLVLAYVSFLPYLQAPSARAFAAMSWDNYLTVFHTDRIGRTLWNTFVMTTVVATSVVIISFLISVVGAIEILVAKFRSLAFCRTRSLAWSWAWRCCGFPSGRQAGAGIQASHVHHHAT